MDTSKQTYLDYNASAPVRPRVRDGMLEALSVAGNPSSVHRAGRGAYNRLTHARGQIASLVGGLPEQVIFTSGGTEANFLAIKGAVGLSRGENTISHILTGASEHPSVLAAVEDTGLPFDVIPVDEDGVIKLGSLEELLAKTKSPCLICVMMANNETGTVQPIMKIDEVARKFGAILHVDAVQAAGKLDLTDLGFGVCTTGGIASGIVSLSVSAHKIGGPQGTGALVLKDGYTIKPLLTGGGQEQGRRSGTENLPGIIGFGIAAELVRGERDGFARRLDGLRDKLERAVKEICPEAVFFSQKADRLANTSCFAIPGLSAEKALINFDLENVYISSGSACSSGKVAMSHVLRAMNVGDDIARCALRISLGLDTREEDIDHFIKVAAKIVDRLVKNRKKNEIATAG